MKTKLLRKIRKRFTIRPCEWPAKYDVLDHELQIVHKRQSWYEVFDTLMYSELGFFTYLSWVKRYLKRKEKHRYLNSIK